MKYRYSLKQLRKKDDPEKWKDIFGDGLILEEGERIIGWQWGPNHLYEPCIEVLIESLVQEDLYR